MKEKVVLAYSGGLDTTAIIPWLKENFDYEVICVCIDCGQAEELDGLDERAKFCGAGWMHPSGVQNRTESRPGLSRPGTVILTQSSLHCFYHPIVCRITIKKDRGHVIHGLLLLRD